LVSLHQGLGPIGGAAVHHQNFCNGLGLSHEAFKTSLDARGFVNDRKDNTDLLGRRLTGDFNTVTAGGSEETVNDTKSQKNLQRTE
jgi:hypothetical protein